MKKLHFFIWFIMLVFAIMPQTISAQQKRKAASLEIMLSDNAPLQIVVNGRIFNVVNKRIVLNDLPAKRNQIEVIRKCDRNTETNCRDQVVFSGRVKFERGKHYQAVVLVGEQQMTVSDKLNLFPSVVFPNNQVAQTAVTNTQQASSSAVNPEATEFINMVTLKEQMPADVNKLGEQMKAAAIDTKKMELAQYFVKNRNGATSVDELLVISSWIMFDENKLTFLKYAYDKVQNPQMYYQLQQAFTLQEYSDQLKDFIK